MTVPKKDTYKMELLKICQKYSAFDESLAIEVLDLQTKWLKQYLHDFPDQFPRNRPKYSIENEFIQKRLEELT